MCVVIFFFDSIFCFRIICHVFSRSGDDTCALLCLVHQIFFVLIYEGYVMSMAIFSILNKRVGHFMKLPFHVHSQSFKFIIFLLRPFLLVLLLFLPPCPFSCTFCRQALLPSFIDPIHPLLVLSAKKKT